MAITQAFGIREVCHCVFTPADTTKRPFVIDTAKMSSIESSSTTVYAQGGSGNSRLIAWEGEKTMTFTVEDALLTLESFRALTGASGTGNSLNIYPYSFAGYYSITAYTLVRTEDGNDHLATIRIPRAKLQTTLNLSMAPSGDPSSFTFTFDVLPSTSASDNHLMFSLDITDGNYSGSLEDETNITNTTTVYINGAGPYTTTATEPTLELVRIGEGNTLSITLKPTGDTITETVIAGEILTNFDEDLQASGDAADLRPGSTTRWYII